MLKSPENMVCWADMKLAHEMLSGCSAKSSNCLRQHLVYPGVTPLARRSVLRLPSYRLLIETNDGNVWFLRVDQRSVPDLNTVEKIAATLVAATTDGCVNGAVEARLCEEVGVTAHVHDDDIEGLHNWEIESVLASTFLDEVTRFSGVSVSRLNDIRQEIMQKNELDLSEQIARFIAALDTDVVALTRSSGGLRPSSYNYLSGNDTITRRNRQQAIRVFPLLLSNLSQDAEYAQIRDAIDHGAPPLFDKLSEFYDAPKSVVRFIAKTPCMVIEENWRSKVGVLIRLMADIQPEFRPRTPIEWERFFRTAEIISKVSRRPVNTTGNRLWLRTSSRKGFYMPEGGRSGLLDMSRVIDDFLTGLREALRHELWVMRKTGDMESEISTAIAHVNRSVGIEKLAQIGRKWGDAYRLEQQSFLHEKEIVLGLRWAAPLQAPAQFANRMVVPLCTPNDLIREANSMNHCVDSYIGHCMRGDSQIWSLRSHDGGRLSTLETRIVRNRNGDFEVHIIQLRAASNCEPSHKCVDAVALMIKHLHQSKCDIENYWRWKVTTAQLTQNQRAMIALVRPIIAALRSTLPRNISFDTLVSIGAKRL